MSDKKGLILGAVVIIGICCLIGWFIGKKVANNEEEKVNEPEIVDDEMTEEEIIKENEATVTGEDLYYFGLSALTCGEFEYGEKTKDGFEVINFAEVNSKFTTDNQVDFLAGGDDFKPFNTDVVEKEGKYYMSHQCDRGSNINYRYTELELVSFDDNEIKMNAISTYCIDETDSELLGYEDIECETYKDTYEFIVRKENNEWKIAKISLPY